MNTIPSARSADSVGCGLMALAFVAVCAALVAAEGKVMDVTRNWRAEQFRRIPVESVTASSVLSGSEGQYAPSRVCDGDRKTKWVASVEPSKDSPQWIRLDLAGGKQTVTAVAVFGERIDNDGILDAEVQLAKPGESEFQTVATIDKADSGSWLATFDPVEAAVVRLVVTRSGGPTTHTDVWEIEVLGPAMSPAELRRHADERLAEAGRHLATLEEHVRSIGADAEAGAKLLSTSLNELAAERGEVAKSMGAWQAMTPPDRDRVVCRAELLSGRVRRLADRLAEVAKVWPARRSNIQSARDAAGTPKASANVVSQKDGGCIILGNRHVLVWFDPALGAWDATWLGSAPAALRQVRSDFEIDGKAVDAGDPRTQEAAFTDKLGAGRQISQAWGAGVRIERSVRVYDDAPTVAIFATITNMSDRDVSLGTMHLVNVAGSDDAWWHVGHVWASPAAVFIGGTSSLLCEPARAADLSGDTARSYGATQILMLANREPTAAMAFGYLTALEARPDLAARFRVCEGGTALSASQRFLGRKLGPGESVDLDPVYLSVHGDPYVALETYGDAAARFTRQPVRTGATALWCSWYAHRMAMTEDLVLANAAVAARHFKPLGFEIMQLDHGWQRGDVTGDWVPNERFPHGLKWLSDELKKRYGFRLGVWISPTDVAETSETFKKHRDWMLKDDEGNPRVNWKWYWAPNPNCYELDASHPEAEKWIADVFAQLMAWGVSYYKIDFIAACQGEHFRHHDPKATRGWTVLRRAMEALRRGAGPKAWVRYCQTPPLLSAGLASSTICGGDTLDAGLGGKIDVLRTNARFLAAGYWLNDRWYHREVCDMSVRMHADVEEVRMRLAMMSLAGCSVSFSDELQYMPASRIRMMQQVLPPGGPPMKPIDLLDRAIPSIWWIHCKTDSDEWDVVGFFNFEAEPQERTVTWRSIGLPDDADAAVFEFWRSELLGVHSGQFSMTLPPQSSRILSIRRLTGRPQVVGTDMHVLQGYHEIKRLAWDAKTNVLSGTCQRMPGLANRLFVYVPAGYAPHFEFPLTDKSASLTNVGAGLWMHEFEFKDASAEWSIPFDGPK